MIYGIFLPIPIVSTYLLAGGIISLLFGGLGVIAFCWSFFDAKPGLVINRQGVIFTDGSLVPWTDINDILVQNILISGKSRQEVRRKFVTLMVKNPQDYIDKQTNLLKRKMAEMTFNICGSPISIGTNVLRISVDDLHSLLVEKMNEYSDR